MPQTSHPGPGACCPRTVLGLSAGRLSKQRRPLRPRGSCGLAGSLERHSKLGQVPGASQITRGSRPPRAGAESLAAADVRAGNWSGQLESGCVYSAPQTWRIG